MGGFHSVVITTLGIGRFYPLLVEPYWGQIMRVFSFYGGGGLY